MCLYLCLSMDMFCQHDSIMKPNREDGYGLSKSTRGNEEGRVWTNTLSVGGSLGSECEHDDGVWLVWSLC